MKKVLVPTDFSECSGYATEVAAQICKYYNATLYILHIIELPIYGTDAFEPNIVDIKESAYLQEMAKKNFKELVSKPYLKDLEVVEIIQYSNVFENISVGAKQHDIDLIVMGSHGSSGFSDYFIGSNTEKIVRMSPCPVLTIKNHHPEFKIRDMVFASNFQKKESPHFDKLFEVVKQFDPIIHLLKVITPEEFEKTRVTNKLINDFIKRYSLENYTVNIYNDYNIEHGILEFARVRDIDLIAITTEGRTGFSRLFNSSLAEDIVNHALRPVLSLKVK